MNSKGMLNVFSRLAMPKRHLHLLKEISPKIEQTVKQARQRLRQITGSPLVWGEPRPLDTLRMPLAAKQSDLPPRRMTDSYDEAILPLTTDGMLKQKYINFYHQVRYGRVIEDLDTMAVAIGYRYVMDPSMADKKSALVIVTAFVDSMNITSTGIVPDQDLIIRGHVSWAGSTSMEITMHVEQRQGEVVDKKMEAKFLMVARDPSNKVKAFVNPLLVETPEEKAYFAQGEVNRINRQDDHLINLLKTPPSPNERQLIHDIFLNTIDEQIGSFKGLIKPPNSVWMTDAKLKNMIICFPEERNLYNKMFGGFLMRSAFELAWANACMYCKGKPILCAVDDIVFRKPVEIGSLLYLLSQVVYTRGHEMEVKVHAEVVDPVTGIHSTTNEFHFTFLSQKTDVPVVMPRTYAEYMMYLDGKRHLERSLTKSL